MMNQQSEVSTTSKGSDIPYDISCETLRLPIHFDPTHLVAELSHFAEADWLSHPQEGGGDSSIPLISVGGTQNIDYAIAGPMCQTHLLARGPYLQQVLQAFGAPLSRCRLVRQVLQVNGQSNQISDPNLVFEQSYHSFRCRAIYVPILTDDLLAFHCGEACIHMAVGEAWTFDPRMPHGFVYDIDNRAPDRVSDITFIHLVIETKGSARLTEMLAQSERVLPLPKGLDRDSTAGRKLYIRPNLGIPYHLGQDGHLSLEPYVFEILTPQELSKLLASMLVEIQKSQVAPDEFAKLVEQVEHFQQRWQQVFERFGHHPAGELAYQNLLVDFQEQIVRKVGKRVGDEGKYAMAIIRSMLETAPAPKRSLRKQVGQRIQLHRQRKNAQRLAEQENFHPPDFDRPLFIVSAPRAGSTLLFETLQHFPELWSTGEENHELVEEIPKLHPAARNYDSNRLTAADVQPEIAAQLRQRFGLRLQNRAGELFVECPPDKRPTSVRFLEKTPKNALRIPFIKSIFPEAQFLFLYREPAANISSMVEGWRTQRFIAYRPLPGWPYRNWSFLLIPGWQSLIDRPIAEIAAYQWQKANQTILDDLATLPDSDWSLVRYDDLVHQPRKSVQQIARFAKLQWDAHTEQRLSQSLPTSSMTLSAPEKQKWRKNGWQIEPLLPRLEPIIQRVEGLGMSRK